MTSTSAARLFRGFSLILFAAALAGCSTTRGTPVRFVPTDDIVKSINLQPEELATMQAATTEAERNHYQNKAVAVIDQRFHQFVRDMAADRADMAATGAGTTLGATTAGAFVESVTAKTNYAIFAAGVIGAFGIIDKNYFYDKTVPALVAAMGAARANVLVRIRNGQAETLASYTGAMALSDLEDYFSAGTVLAAIAEITARADSDKQAALTEVRTIEVLSDEEIARRRTLSRAIFAVNEQSLDKARKALAALGGSEAKTVKEARLGLLRAMRPPTKERIDLVQKALKDAGLLN